VPPLQCHRQGRGLLRLDVCALVYAVSRAHAHQAAALCLPAIYLDAGVYRIKGGRQQARRGLVLDFQNRTCYTINGGKRSNTYQFSQILKVESEDGEQFTLNFVGNDGSNKGGVTCVVPHTLSPTVWGEELCEKRALSQPYPRAHPPSHRLQLIEWGGRDVTLCTLRSIACLAVYVIATLTRTSCFTLAPTPTPIRTNDGQVRGRLARREEPMLPSARADCQQVRERTHTHTHTLTTHARTHTHTHARTHTHTLTHSLTHTHTHSLTHTLTHSPRQQPVQPQNGGHLDGHS
jgi:hypothetical protein